MVRIGLDIGSTTVKAVAVDTNEKVIYESYRRHMSRITEMSAEMLSEIKEKLDISEAKLCVTGSAAMGFAEQCGIQFVQEVYATRVSTDRIIPGTDVVIELGGEDAKILFLSGGSIEVRMNGSCAGGTGAFIDQMATLLGITPEELDILAEKHQKIYTIASRCGVFAKSDIQPLINQGAQKPDICASILYAVVNQTVGGLAQGREINGNVVYLGGPLTFMKQLRSAFDKTLEISGTLPQHSLYFVALGAAMLAEETIKLDGIISTMKNYISSEGYRSCAPLFESRDEYDKFAARHAKASISVTNNTVYSGKAYVGIDAGSTTVKAVATDEDGNILCSDYRPNGGNPIPFVQNFLMSFAERFPQAKLCASAVTGYGEEMIRSAFNLDYGIVETVAHFTAAHKFQPDVSFIIDIGGQDIKCFKIRNGAIDNIFLNEACSSGCGSFLQTFAGALGYPIEEFSSLGLFADNPVDLGSRCTVFMNSSVKQAQKDGASVGNISAGLSISVVKNALYKVIRVSSPEELGEHIVVQGGTFLNDAVLRAFEREVGREVIRPTISGIMGAYGAALYAQSKAEKDGLSESATLSGDELKNLVHTVKMTTCKGCQNHCSLTINTFGTADGGDKIRRFIGGNRCDKMISGKASENKLNMFEYKNELLDAYKPIPGNRGKIGIPMGLNMYELFPLWHTLFTRLGFEVIRSGRSSHELYLLGQTTIPSDTVCYPAKLIHGHVKDLVNRGIDKIFYPCMSYNVDEHKGDNNYNCPVVAYYPELIEANMRLPENITLINDYVGIHRKKDFISHFYKILQKYFDGISKSEVKAAAEAAYEEYGAHMSRIRTKGAEILEKAYAADMPVIVLAGRPYHIDGEINHGIDRLICDYGAAVISEDAVSELIPKFEVGVLNQWTYHSRMYCAAKYVAKESKKHPKLNLVQLVSFGCGVDAITTDEVRSILEEDGRIYTQIKIDEITNLGAVKIRLRSLFSTL